MLVNYLNQIALLAKRLLVCYFLFFICRLVYYLGNLDFFQQITLVSFLKTCFYGLRFDAFSITVANSLFIVLSLLPINHFTKKYYQRILKIIFLISNTVFSAFNFIDVAYLPFIKKRSTSEIFEQMAGQSDLSKLIPQFLIDFWWVLLFFLISVYLLYKLYNRIQINVSPSYTLKPIKQWLLIVLLFVISIGIGVLFVRGGLQRVPIDVVNASAVCKPHEVPLVLNTPFTIIKSISQSKLKPYHFYSEAELKELYNPIHHFKDSVFKPQNVVVLILESFSKEYTKLGRVKSITPFLDSLMDKSLVFTNGFSNGTKSIEGIPAILSSLPSLMPNPFINSVYAYNKQTSFATLLKSKGYETAFFHGGINGTMNFTDWAPSAQYTHYFGRNEYDNEADFDGYWGIWDEPFLQYSILKMNEFKQPFHSAIFTLSSHHPYFVPEKYKNTFPKTELENAESIGYADHSLKLFFESAKKTAWYNNTLFILTADHAGISGHPFFANPVGNLTIPILFFKPDNSIAGTNPKVFSQMDILPSAMSILGYNQPFFAFGESFTSQKEGHACFFNQGSHYTFEDTMAFMFNDTQLIQVYNYHRDSALYQNVFKMFPDIEAINKKKHKVFLQTYHSTLMNNTGSIEK